MLPPGLEGFLQMTVQEQHRFLQDRHDNDHEFLMPLTDWPEVSCKYSALFMDTPACDRYRFTFLTQLCADAELQSLPVGMLEDFDALQEVLDPVELARVLEAATIHIPQYTEVQCSSGPPSGFVEAAWPLLVKTMCTHGYYLSMDELLLLCGVAKQSVAVFEKCAEYLAYRGAVSIPQCELVLISLDCGRGISTRGHYERIVLSSDVAVLDAAIQQERSEAAKMDRLL